MRLSANESDLLFSFGGDESAAWLTTAPRVLLGGHIEVKLEPGRVAEHRDGAR
jgi:hypothetical protein